MLELGKDSAGTSPITITSGKRPLVEARYIGNRHLADASYLWAFCPLTHSAGARRYYDQLRAKGVEHDGALRALANRLVGILHPLPHQANDLRRGQSVAHHRGKSSMIRAANRHCLLTTTARGMS